MTDLVSVDTVQFELQDFEIREGADIVVKPMSFNMGTGRVADGWSLFKCANVPHEGIEWDAGWVRGSHAYRNVKIDDGGGVAYELTIAPVGDKVRCFLKCSVPKIVGKGNNFKPVEFMQMFKVFQMIEVDLDRAGIGTDLLKAPLSRLDVFRNIETDSPVHEYWIALQKLHASRKKRKEFGGEGYLWENTQQEIAAYDKKKEMAFRGLETDDYNETMRVEIRYKNKRTTSRETEICSMNQLLMEKHGGQNRLREIYVEKLKSEIFKHNPEDFVFTINSEELRVVFAHFKKNQGRNWQSKILSYHGLLYFMENNDIESLRDAIGSVADNRMQSSRFMKEISKVLEWSVDTPKYTKQNVLKFYKELKEKLLK